MEEGSMKFAMKRHGLFLAGAAVVMVLSSCASMPAGPSKTDKVEFSLGAGYGERKSMDFELTAAGLIRAEAQWTGSSTGLALILNGPGQTGAYKRVDGQSPLSLSQSVTPEIIAKGIRWTISIVCWDTNVSVKGTLRVDYPEGAQVSLGEELLVDGAFSQGLGKWQPYNAATALATFAAAQNAAVIRIITPGKSSGDIQLTQGSPGFAVKKGGIYRLSFDAVSSVEHTLNVTISENGNDLDKDGFAWSPHATASFRLGTAMGPYAKDLWIKSDNPKAGIIFLLGNLSGELKLARISLREVIQGQ
jgi:hypothetical protein